MPSHLVKFWFTKKLIHIRLLLIIESIMFTDLVVSKWKKKKKTRLTVHSSRFRRAASLTDPWTCFPLAGPEEGAVCTEGTAPALSLTRFLLRHPMLNCIKLHHITGMIILRCKVFATHHRVFRSRCRSEVPSLHLHKTHPGPEDSTILFLVWKPVDSMSWKAGVCATSTNTIIYHDDDKLKYKNFRKHTDSQPL